MVSTPIVSTVSFEGNFLLLTIEGLVHKFDLALISPRLHRADDMQRALFTISPSGYGIHWPLLDEDLSVPALLRSEERDGGGPR